MHIYDRSFRKWITDIITDRDQTQINHFLINASSFLHAPSYLSASQCSRYSYPPNTATLPINCLCQRETKLKVNWPCDLTSLSPLSKYTGTLPQVLQPCSTILWANVLISLP